MQWYRSETDGFLARKKYISGTPFSYFKFLCFQLAFIFEMEVESWTLSTSVPGNIETPKIDRNMEIPEDLGPVIYDITNTLENFGNGLKQLKENT